VTREPNALNRDRLGAVPDANGGVAFIVWAPDNQSLQVIVEGRGTFPLERDDHGYFRGHVSHAKVGDLYWYQLESGQRRPDPASRFQPGGPHGPSQVVDPAAYRWHDEAWPGITAPHRQVLYELHLGTFTRAGTWEAAIAELAYLASVGITTLEVMPIAEFPGEFGWGYDGVDLFAPCRRYGTPDEARAFVDAAHRLGLAVILDVVYNHLGPDGNYLRDFARAYFAEQPTDWGDAMNFDGPQSAHVRRFFVENAAYWIDEFHFDGLRLDALHAIQDSSPVHIVSELAVASRRAARGRAIFLVGEHEAQHAERLRNDATGVDGMDALWNDDWHHAAGVRLTGRRRAYFTDYRGTAQEFASMARHGFLYQGQWYSWQRGRRGTRSRGLPGRHFVVFLDNHDQVANTGLGWRVAQLSDARTFRALTALLLLGPHLPMLFQGQEFGATTRFHYFADHRGELADAVAKGRVEFLSQFPEMTSAEMLSLLPLPSAPATLESSTLDWRERDRNGSVVRFHSDLISLRRSDPVLAEVGTPAVTVETAAMSDDLLVVHYQSKDGERLLIVNLGEDRLLEITSEPLLAPPAGHDWQQRWSSEHPEYGGTGSLEFASAEPWLIPGRTATLLEPQPMRRDAESVRRG
jgi:maltooligosyltrehalose trehalohydrolase